MPRRLFTVKNLIRAALTAFSLANMGVAHAHIVGNAGIASVAIVAAPPVR
jgi:hypothetical protein